MSTTWRRPSRTASGRVEVENTVESYADLAVVPNLGKSGYVMPLNGLTIQATEASGGW